MKKYAILFLTLAAMFSVDKLSAQSDLFGEAANQNFLEAIQPALLEQAADPATTPYDFMLIAKRLGVYGDKTSAVEMGKWLGDPQKSHSARNALEEMPFDEALDVLRGALDMVDTPALKAGVIDSLGMRRDAGAVEKILPLLENENDVISNAAFFALSRIAQPAYRETLTQKITAGDDAAKRQAGDLLLMYGEFLRRDGNESDALSVFNAVIENAPADFYKESACYQILLNETDDARAKAAAWLAGNDTTAANAALRAAAFVKSDGVCDVLLAALDNAPQERKPAILAALGDQKNVKAQSALLAALMADDETVKTAAIGALKACADPASLNSLINTALSGDEKIQSKTIEVIALLDDVVNPKLLELLDGDEAQQAFGAQIIATRKIADGRTKLLALTSSDSENVRCAALSAIGRIADVEVFNALANAYAVSDGKTAESALTGLRSACGTVSDRNAVAETLEKTADALADHASKKEEIFKLYAVTGGTAALDAVKRAALSDDKTTQDLATRSLGAWMTIDAEETLLKLAATPGYPYANRALRGALRLARQFAMPDWKRRAIIRDALASPTCGDKEKEIADIIIKQYRLDMSVPETDEQKLLRRVELVRALYGDLDDPSRQKDVTGKLAEQFVKAETASVTLDGFNTFFGGDPAPNTHKKLRVTISCTDTGVETTFDVNENQPITIPRP